MLFLDRLFPRFLITRQLRHDIAVGWRSMTLEDVRLNLILCLSEDSGLDAGGQVIDVVTATG